jgi:hypothetical protein
MASKNKAGKAKPKLRIMPVPTPTGPVPPALKNPVVKPTTPGGGTVPIGPVPPSMKNPIVNALKKKRR